ncbi:MAG: diadenylate cyclase CdaA [Spirochaetales bacterium]|nr:diadenylate cyclase CdaA [Spirochaetales bacterium]
MSWSATTQVFRDIVLPGLDILILAFLLYKSYQILVQTKAVQLVKGVALIVLIYGAAFFFNLRTLMWVLNLMVPGLVIGLAIIFQPELRKIFTRIGQGGWFKFSHSDSSMRFEALLNAAEVLSAQRRGALVVLARQVGLKNYIDTGTRLDSEISSALILTIFAFDTAMHDGAVIIEGGRVAAAGCFLPLSEQPDIRRSFGTRHRAALGLTEETDAVVLVVSEESGAMSLAYEGNLLYDLPVRELSRRLKELLSVSQEAEGEAADEVAFDKE